MRLQFGPAHLRYGTNWIKYSPNGSMIAFPQRGNDVHFYDLASNKIVQKVSRQYALVSGSFTPDGKAFAAGGYDHDEEKRYYIWLWNVKTGKVIRKFNNGKHGLRSLDITSDGKRLAAGGMDGQVRLWNLHTGQLLHQFSEGESQIWSIAFSPDGKTLAAAGDSIYLFDLSSKKSRLKIPRKAIELHFSKTSEVLTGAVAGSICRWDTKTGMQLTPIAIDGSIEQVKLGLNGRVIITHDYGGMVDWMDPTNTTSRLGMSFLPSGRELPRMSVIHIWDRATGKQLRRIQLDPQGQIEVTPDGRYLVLGVDDPKFKYTPKILGCKLKLFDLNKQVFIDRFTPISAAKAQLKAFTPDGKTLVTVDTRSSEVRLWDVATGLVRREFSAHHSADSKEMNKVMYAVMKSSLSPDGKTLALAYSRHALPFASEKSTLLRLWDISTGKLLHQLKGHSNEILDLAFSPDGRFLASCEESPKDKERITQKDSFHIWDTTTGERIQPLPQGLPARANRVAFSPDGRTLASSSFDGSVTLWEVASSTRRTTFQAHHDHVTTLCYGNEGTLFTGSTDATVLAWKLRPTKPTKEISLTQAWDNLQLSDASKAYDAQGRFLANPTETMKFFTKHLAPIQEIDSKEIAKLLGQLDSKLFSIREKATQELAKVTRLIEKELRKTLAETRSVEVRRRIEGLLKQIGPSSYSSVELQQIRAVEVLNWLATTEAKNQLTTLSNGEERAILTQVSRDVLQRLKNGGH